MLIHDFARSPADVGRLRALLEAGADPNTLGKYGVPPLYDAAAFGNAPGIRLLVEYGADVRWVPPDGRDTTLVQAIFYGHSDAVSLLLALGVPSNSTNPRSVPLIWAVRADAPGAADMVRALLAAGADVTMRDEGFRTALHWAAERGPVEIIDSLLLAGADPHAPDRYGASPWQIAMTMGRLEIA